MIRKPSNSADPTIVALQALAVALRDSQRAQRLLELTGLTSDELRARATEPHMLAAVLSFLEAHEPDLIAVADELGISPQELVAARSALEA
ncbi:DUF3572 domain-containing protein [Sphingomonas sp. BN140010]|uniref:DUF3572 domain-containing protein n=1 Tax=Sphingomonas arvum TaxID=2992113 RepID=A0ABT3JF16_9SPHN|nr:DUF3572 domain-containing protein [Sphingomonas sp. BN140010]